MKNTLTCLCVLVLATVISAQAAISGRWRGQTTNGTEIILDLTATETALTGTMVRNLDSVIITDGKASKNTFTFKATINDQTEGFTGEVNGDEIKVWLDRQGPERAAILKRMKK